MHKCPYCGHDNTHKAEEASWRMRREIWYCDDCEGRTFEPGEQDELTEREGVLESTRGIKEGWV